MAKLQNTFLEERKLQRIQESWKIPSFLETLTMEGAAQESPSPVGHVEMAGSASCHQ